MSGKKGIGRNVAIALSIVAVLLAVGLAGAIASYTSIIGSRDRTIGEKNDAITNLQSQISEKDEEIASLNDTINWLRNTLGANLTRTIALAVWNSESQNASSYTSWNFSAKAPGYVSVFIHTATTNNTYVQVIYSAYGINYNQTTITGARGTAAFPVLPATIEIRIGNSNTVDKANITATITYHY